MTGNERRFIQLYEAALNLGMDKSAAAFYADETLAREKAIGEWSVVPRSAEALANDGP